MNEYFDDLPKICTNMKNSVAKSIIMPVVDCGPVEYRKPTDEDWERWKAELGEKFPWLKKEK